MNPVCWTGPLAARAWRDGPIPRLGCIVKQALHSTHPSCLPKNFELVVRIIGPRLSAWITAIVGGDGAQVYVAEIFQAVITALWTWLSSGNVKHLPATEADAELLLFGWLKTVVGREVSSFWRQRHWARTHIESDEILETLPDRLNCIGSLDLRLSLEECLEAIPSRKRRAITMQTDGYSYREIAKLLGYSTDGAARTSVARGRMALRAALSDDSPARSCHRDTDSR